MASDYVPKIGTAPVSAGSVIEATGSDRLSVHTWGCQPRLIDLALRNYDLIQYYFMKVSKKINVTRHVSLCRPASVAHRIRRIRRMILDAASLDAPDVTLSGCMTHGASHGAC